MLKRIVAIPFSKQQLKRRNGYGPKEYGDKHVDDNLLFIFKITCCQKTATGN